MTDAKKTVVTNLARDRFIAYGMLKTSSNAHGKIKSDLSDDFTKGRDNYPITPQQTLLLLDKYSKKPAVVTHSEGTAFAQGGTKKKSQRARMILTPRMLSTTRNSTRTRIVSNVEKRGIPRQHAQ